MKIEFSPCSSLSAKAKPLYVVPRSIATVAMKRFLVPKSKCLRPVYSKTNGVTVMEQQKS